MVPAGAGGTRAKLAQLPTQGRHRLPRLDFGPGWCPVPRKPGGTGNCGHGAGPRGLRIWPCMEIGPDLPFCPG